MSDFVYTPAKQKLAKALLDFDTVDLRVKLCMSNTTADTDQDAATLSAISTIDAYDGSGYTEITLGASTITQDDANNRSEVDYGDGTFGAAVGPGTRSWVGLMYYVRVNGNPANDYPVAWKDLTTNNGNGGSLALTVDAQGLIQIT